MRPQKANPTTHDFEKELGSKNCYKCHWPETMHTVDRKVEELMATEPRRKSKGKKVEPPKATEVGSFSKHSFWGSDLATDVCITCGGKEKNPNHFTKNELDPPTPVPYDHIQLLQKHVYRLENNWRESNQKIVNRINRLEALYEDHVVIDGEVQDILKELDDLHDRVDNLENEVPSTKRPTVEAKTETKVEPSKQHEVWVVINKHSVTECVYSSYELAIAKQRTWNMEFPDHGP